MPQISPFRLPLSLHTRLLNEECAKSNGHCLHKSALTRDVTCCLCPVLLKFEEISFEAMKEAIKLP